jgi:hypothetical protein
MELILLLEAQNGIEKNQNYHLKERRKSLHFVSCYGLFEGIS